MAYRGTICHQYFECCSTCLRKRGVITNNIMIETLWMFTGKFPAYIVVGIGLLKQTPQKKESKE